MKKLYGRSFSLCIKDLAEDNINPNNVGAIVTSTRAKNENDFEALVNHCSKIYWDNNPKAITIAYKLWNDGKIIQPRLKNNDLYQNLAYYPVWGDSLEDVQNSVMVDYD
jgi:hypothetical protein